MGRMGETGATAVWTAGQGISTGVQGQVGKDRQGQLGWTGEQRGGK